MRFNPLIVALAASPLHWLISRSVLVVQYTGRSSGKKYAVPVNYVIEAHNGSHRVWITSRRERVWWRNFTQGNDGLLILQGRRRRVTLNALTANEEVAQGLSRYFQAAPAAAKFFDVSLDKDCQARAEDLMDLALERVVLYADLEPD